MAAAPRKAGRKRAAIGGGVRKTAASKTTGRKYRATQKKAAPRKTIARKTAARKTTARQQTGGGASGATLATGGLGRLPRTITLETKLPGIPNIISYLLNACSRVSPEMQQEVGTTYVNQIWQGVRSGLSGLSGQQTGSDETQTSGQLEASGESTDAPWMQDQQGHQQSMRKRA